jgi:hypothetical protein
MSNPLYRTIILTSSIRVTAANEKDLDTISDNLIGSINAAYNNGILSEGCDEDTSVDAIESDTEVCDDGDDEDNEEEG